MIITESRPFDLIRINLEFLKPFKATNTAEFTFAAKGGEVAVTWSTFGRNNFLAKTFWLLMNVDNMMGAEFEKGLRQLKSTAENVSPS